MEGAYKPFPELSSLEIGRRARLLLEVLVGCKGTVAQQYFSERLETDILTADFWEGMKKHNQADTLYVFTKIFTYYPLDSVERIFFEALAKLTEETESFDSFTIMLENETIPPFVTGFFIPPILSPEDALIRIETLASVFSLENILSNHSNIQFICTLYTLFIKKIDKNELDNSASFAKARAQYSLYWLLYLAHDAKPSDIVPEALETFFPQCNMAKLFATAGDYILKNLERFDDEQERLFIHLGKAIHNLLLLNIYKHIIKKTMSEPMIKLLNCVAETKNYKEVQMFFYVVAPMIEITDDNLMLQEMQNFGARFEESNNIIETGFATMLAKNLGNEKYINTILYAFSNELSFHNMKPEYIPHYQRLLTKRYKNIVLLFKVMDVSQLAFALSTLQTLDPTVKDYWLTKFPPLYLRCISSEGIYDSDNLLLIFETLITRGKHIGDFIGRFTEELGIDKMREIAEPYYPILFSQQYECLEKFIEVRSMTQLRYWLEVLQKVPEESRIYWICKKIFPIKDFQRDELTKDDLEYIFTNLIQLYFASDRDLPLPGIFRITARQNTTLSFETKPTYTMENMEYKIIEFLRSKMNSENQDNNVQNFLYALFAQEIVILPIVKCGQNWLRCYEHFLKQQKKLSFRLFEINHHDELIEVLEKLQYIDNYHVWRKLAANVSLMETIERVTETLLDEISKLYREAAYHKNNPTTTAPTWKEECKKAIYFATMLQKLVASSIEVALSKLSTKARFVQGKCHYMLENYNDALSTFSYVYRNFDHLDIEDQPRTKSYNDIDIHSISSKENILFFIAICYSRAKDHQIPETVFILNHYKELIPIINKRKKMTAILQKTIIMSFLVQFTNTDQQEPLKFKDNLNNAITNIFFGPKTLGSAKTRIKENSTVFDNAVEQLATENSIRQNRESILNKLQRDNFPRDTAITNFSAPLNHMRKVIMEKVPTPAPMKEENEGEEEKPPSPTD